MNTVPPCLYPSLQLNVALLSCSFPLLSDTFPLLRALALDPVHCVRVQLPLGTTPSHVMEPLNPGKHAHSGPGALSELATLHGTAANHMYGYS